MMPDNPDRLRAPNEPRTLISLKLTKSELSKVEALRRREKIPTVVEVFRRAIDRWLEQK